MALSDADAFHFELQFQLPTDQRVWAEEAQVTLGSVFGDDRLLLRASEGGKLREVTRLSLLGSGYETTEQAHDAAERARHALVLAAIDTGLAIEWRDRPPRRPGGLSVWRGYGPLIMEAEVTLSASLQYLINADAFRQKLTSRLVECVCLTSEQHACVELLRSFEFDQNVRSRLVLAMAAIEQLAARSLQKSAEHQRAIASLAVALAEMEVENGDVRKELAGNLKGLAYLSSRGRCIRLIEARLGGTAAREFKELSDFRNKVAHEGMSGGEGWSVASRAFDLARRLLFADIAAAGSASYGD